MQKKYLWLLACAFNLGIVNAQVGIGTTSPHNSSILHLNSPNKGLLLTSIALTSSTDATTIPSPATGLLVWNNGTGGLTPVGLYYWHNSQWNILNTGNSTSGFPTPNAWNTSGSNAGFSLGSGTALSIGTSTYDDLVFKVNTTAAGRLTANNAILLGVGTSGNQNAIAIGVNAKANQNETTAIGYNSSAAGYQSLAVGYQAKTASNSETAVGFNAETSNQNSTALGSGTKGLGQNSVALGYNAQTNAYNSTALGPDSRGSAQNATGLGYNARATAANSTALGADSFANGANSTAIGYGVTTNQNNAIVIGNSLANIGIGTNTPNVNSKLDVGGTYKLGEKGTIQKNQFSFNVYPSINIANLGAGQTTTLDIPISPGLLSGTQATVTVTPAGNFLGTTFAISNPRLSSTNNVVINLTNISGSAASLYSGQFYVMINEF